MPANKDSRVKLEEIIDQLTSYATAISGKSITIIPQGDGFSAIGKRTFSSDVKDGICIQDNINSGINRDATLLEYRIIITLEALIIKASYEKINLENIRGINKSVNLSDGIILSKTELSKLFNNKKPASYLDSFFVLLNSIEMGRIRQQIHHNYPALDEDIDNFMKARTSMATKDKLIRYKTYVKDWKRYVIDIYNNPLSQNIRKEIMTEEELSDELVSLELSHLLLFSNEDLVKGEKANLSERSLRIYDKVIKVISREYAERTDSVKLAIEILDKEFEFKEVGIMEAQKLQREYLPGQEVYGEYAMNTGSRPPGLVVVKSLIGKPNERQGIDKDQLRKNLQHERYKSFGTTNKGLTPTNTLSLSLDSDKRLETIELVENKKRQVEEVKLEVKVDEWDSRTRQYIRKACRIRELKEYRDTMGTIARPSSRVKFSDQEVGEIVDALEVLRPEGKITTSKLTQGKLDFDEWIKYRTARKLGLNPKPRYFMREERKERDVAHLILIDISGSSLGYPSKAAIEAKMRIIDCEEHGVLHYAGAVKELGDDLAILAYNSRGRDNVEVLRLLDFGEEINLTKIVKKLMKINPSGNNHDGAAIRYVLYNYLLDNPAKTKILTHIGDGLPKDETMPSIDMAEYEGIYAIEDTRKAIEECSNNGVIPFCFSYAKEQHRDILNKVWKGKYKMLKNPYSLGRKLAEVIIEKTQV